MVQMNAHKDLFWKLLEPEYKRAMMFCRKMTQHKESGDDLFQDALVIGIRKFDQLKDHAAFRPWLYRIIINRFKSSLRKNSFRKSLPFTKEAESLLISDNPSKSHMANLWLEKLYKAISPEEKGLILLYEMEQWTIAELAEAYNKSEGAIKLKLFRIRNKMKKELKRLSNQSEKSLDDLYSLINVYVM